LRTAGAILLVELLHQGGEIFASVVALHLGRSLYPTAPPLATTPAGQAPPV
jgi:hypothetical protein